MLYHACMQQTLVPVLLVNQLININLDVHDHS